MNKITVTVGSVTYAIKLRKLLAKDGIYSIVTKVDNTESKTGCTHGVIISESDLYGTIAILKENRIDYSIYGDND